MAIPEDDLGPAWLRDYGRIEADIAEMAAFAEKLIDDIQSNYVPHANLVFADMSAEPPQPSATFQEHLDFLVAHRDTMVATSDNVYWFTEETTELANAAAEISRRYAGADAFASAKVTEVEKALDDTTGDGTR